MTEAKPLASLSGTLLARKGGARPAMRPQFQRLDRTEDPEALEDLGWDDMGDVPETRGPAEVLPLTPSPVTPEARAEAKAQDRMASQQLAASREEVVEPVASDPAEDWDAPATAEPPAVRRQQDELARRVEKPTAPKEAVKDKPAVRKVRRRSAFARGKKAAFTLRLDQDRHLKLRLASTLANRSAQVLLTEALDRMLKQMPEIDTLAAQVNRPKA